jgi:hypothetical protein
MIASNPFDREKHLYRNMAFVELVKDAVRFFNGTPVHVLPPLEGFSGTGVYALYYIGANPIYAKYAALNRLAYHHPIYIGKAVPKGWRQARLVDNAGASRELYSRLREHDRSITSASGLATADFMCRFVIFEADGSDMISTIESALIKLHHPLWNVALDGFGNHDPGKGRYGQAQSDWDVLHPGRAWAAKCQGLPTDVNVVMAQVEQHFRGID